MPPESFASLHSGRSWSRAWTCYSRGGFDEYSFSVAQMVKCLVAWQTVRLPNAERAQVERSKIVDYLLSPTHPIGRSKAKFFRRFGFRDDQWEVMATALRKHAVSHDVVEAVDFAFGRRILLRVRLNRLMGEIRASERFGWSPKARCSRGWLPHTRRDMENSQ